MRRREFLGVLVGSAAAVPVPVRAQQKSRPPIIGFLGTDPTIWSSWTTPFIERLRELNWIDRRTATIEYRWDAGLLERSAEYAAEFVRLRADVVLTYGIAVPPLKQATSTIPIVFAIAIDPVGAGLVASLARPGGNVTGLSYQGTDLAGKRFELLREAVPNLRRLAVLVNAVSPEAISESRAVHAACRTFDVELLPLEVRRAEDIEPAFASINAKADALYVVLDALVNANRTRIITLALGARLPAMFGTRDYVRAGGLISYGPSFPAMFRRSAELVDKILHGAKPADIPVEQPTKFELVLNTTAAKAIGLAIPESILRRTDEMIE